MSLANVDSSYKSRLKGLLDKCLSFELTEEGEAAESSRAGGYVRFRFRRRGNRKPERAGVNIPFTPGGDRRELEDAVDEQVADIAVDPGSIWIEAMRTGGTNPFAAVRVESDGGEVSELQTEPHAAGAAILSVAARMLESSRRTELELIRELRHTQHAFTQVAVEHAVLADRQETTLALAAAESNERTISSVVDGFQSLLVELGTTPGGQDLLRSLGGLPPSGNVSTSSEEQPAGGPERTLWSLTMAARLVEDVVEGRDLADRALRDRVEVQEQVGRIRAALLVILDFYTEERGEHEQGE